MTFDTNEEHAEARKWNDFRINYLTANGWFYDSPGCYIHRETRNQFHPYEPVLQEDGQPVEQWRVLAAEDKAPDPEKTHIERRREFYDLASS